jgi:hypothetical protein
MTPVDFFYISLGAGFLILVGCVVTVTVQIWKILTDVKSVTGDVAGVASDLTSLKEGIKVAGISLVQNLLEKAKQKGGASKKHGKEEE